MTDTPSSVVFSDLGLAAPLMKALHAQGYTTPTPIQAQAIPIVRAGDDLLGIAQTGTGKTAAFALPTLDHILRDDTPPPKRGAHVLVLAPTRELARQIAQSFRTYGTHMRHLSVATIFGGASVRGQIKSVVGGNDIIVATPGRLIDLIEQKAITLKDVQVLILDEADQMMDMGFIHALRKIVPLLPKDRQTLFFSATMPKSIAKLSQQFLTNPKTVTVTPAATTAERVEQTSYRVNQKEKQALLTLTLRGIDYNRVLVFSRTKHGCDRIVKKLAAADIKAAALHGNKSQGQRQRILSSFKDGDVSVLVATDIAARGIDIDGITHVINFDVPNVADQYVHRIGRTARAGRSGLAISFVAPDERPYLKDIQKLIGQTLPVIPLPENFNQSVQQIASLKPVKIAQEPGTHKRGQDPRRGRGGPSTGDGDPRRARKRKQGFRKKAEAAKADIASALSPESATKPKAHRPGKDTRNPDGSRAERRRRSAENAGRDDRARGSKPSGKAKVHKPKTSSGKTTLKAKSGKPSSVKPSSAKPSGDGLNRKTRKAPDSKGRRGGDQPPKRRTSPKRR